MNDLEALLDRDYVVEARKRGGRYYLTIQELGVFASAETYADAYSKLERRKTDYFNHHLSCGTADRLPLPRDAKEKKELRPFFIKATVVALVGALLMSAASISFSYTSRDRAYNLGQKAGRATLQQFMKGMQKFAEKETTPEREEKIRAIIRDAIPKLKPYIDELRPLFDNGDTRP